MRVIVMIKQLHCHKRARGMSIIELVVTIVILSLALASLAGLIGMGLSQSSNTLIETRAVALGYSYLEEILGRRYDERTPASGTPPCHGLSGGGRCTAEASFGPDGGETRPRYDDVDDFHGLAEGAGEADPLQDAEGNDRTGYDNFRVEVTVRYGGDDAVYGGNETDAKFITVNVENSALDLDWDFSAYRGNF
jgi:MSHA pilin protein MshD